MSLSTSAAHNSSPAIRHITKSGRQANYCDLFIKLYFDNATKGACHPAACTLMWKRALSCETISPGDLSSSSGPSHPTGRMKAERHEAGCNIFGRYVWFFATCSPSAAADESWPPSDNVFEIDIRR